jgi:nucleotide-binding universal stress UspA family protein
MKSQAGRIVVGHDGSEHSLAALDWAAAQAQQRDLPLTVLTVFDQMGISSTAFGGPIWPAMFRDQAVEIAHDGGLRARKIAPTIDIDTVTVLAQVAHGLIEGCRDAALLVIGTRGHGEVAGALLGSVAFAVSAHAHCPVVVVRGDSSQLPGPGRAVVVGVDGSTGSSEAVQYAAGVAANSGAVLIVAAAYQSSASQVWAETTGGLESGGAATFDSLVRTDAEAKTAKAVKLALELHPELKVQERVIDARAVDAIVATAKGCGLLVLGSRGHGGFAGLMLGSVSHQLIHSAPCPVAVVRTSPVPSVPN